MLIFEDKRAANIEIGDSLQGKELAELIAALPTLERVQLDACNQAKARLTPGLIAALVEQVFRKRPEIQLRIFGGAELEMSFLADLPMLQNLRIEVSTRIADVAALLSCKHLKKLHLGLPKSADVKLLALVPPTVEELAIWPATSAVGALDLLPLAHMQRLRLLNFNRYGQQLDAVLPRLSRLQVLRLQTISRLETLESLAGLKALHTVAISHGGIANLDPLTQLPALRCLQLASMPKLTNIDVVGRLLALEGLFFATLKNVKKFPRLAALRKLQVVKLAGMAALRDFSAFEKAPRLQEFVFQRADRQRPTDFEPVLRNKSLKRGGFGFHKKSDVQTMSALLAKHRIDGEVYMNVGLRGTYSRLDQQC